MIDLTTVTSGQRKISDLATEITVDDLRTSTNEQVDTMLDLIGDLSDAQVVFAASDPAAENGVGWNAEDD